MGVSLYGVIRELWKTGWICHIFGRESLVFVEVEWSTLNGPWRRAVSFAFGCVVRMLVPSNHIRSPSLNIQYAMGYLVSCIS